VGLSQDGQILYLAVIDGRQPGYSVGTTLYETALWMRWLGCWEALNLDGGGSTTLVIEDELGLPYTVNRPIQEKVPGQQRPSANHLGVFGVPVKR
jgi:exopolysaccharide biosynthesis protein